MTLLQLYVNNNSTLFDLFENEETKRVTFKEILDCKCDEIFDEKNFDEKTIEPNIPTETKSYKSYVSFANLIKPNYKTELLKTLTCDSAINFSISQVMEDFENSLSNQKNSVDKYFNLFKNLKLKELISYNNRKKEEQLEIDTENKQADLKLQKYLDSLPSTFEEIKINFTKLSNGKELIDFLNHYNVTPIMLMDYIEHSTIFTNELYNNDDYPFDFTFEICENEKAQNLTNNFLKFMNYNINYQIIERYTQLGSINFLAIFEFKNLRLGSIGELSSRICSNDNPNDPDEVYINFGEFIEIKKKKVQFEIWEKI